MVQVFEDTSQLDN